LLAKVTYIVFILAFTLSAILVTGAAILISLALAVAAATIKNSLDTCAFCALCCYARVASGTITISDAIRFLAATSNKEDAY
jgi:hypothetical protein